MFATNNFCFEQFAKISTQFGFVFLLFCLFINSLIYRIEPSSCSISNRPTSSSMYTMSFLYSHDFFPIVHLTLKIHSTYATKVLLELTRSCIQTCKVKSNRRFQLYCKAGDFKGRRLFSCKKPYSVCKQMTSCHLR